MMARQLAYFAAREKDSGRRCDIEAGMAKLLAARSRGATPTTPCKFTAATATRSSTRSAACSTTRASSTSSKAPAHVPVSQFLAQGIAGGAELTLYPSPRMRGEGAARLSPQMPD